MEEIDAETSDANLGFWSRNWIFLMTQMKTT